MNKVSITLEVNKFNKDKIVSRTIQTKDGEKQVKEYKVDLIELETPKFVTQGTTKTGKAWKMMKTHFVAEPKKTATDPTVYIGSGFQFEYEDSPQNKLEDVEAKMSKAEDDFFGDEQPEEIKGNEIPF